MARQVNSNFRAGVGVSAIAKKKSIVTVMHGYQYGKFPKFFSPS